MRFLVVYILFLSLLPIGVYAQDTFMLSGYVRDANNIPVPQAMVFIESTNMGAYSNKEGKYALEITQGEHTVLVSAYGYSLQKQTIKISSNKILNFTLKEKLIDISVVDVYGKSESQQLRESNFTVNAIEIKSQSSSLNNINTLVGRSSGVNIREDGGIGSDFELSINGLSGNSIRYFIDGIPLSSKGNGVSLANLPVNIVDRIEIYKGVVPTELGSDALGGAINIITKSNVKNYIDASYGIGSFGTHRADVNAQYVHSSGLFVRPSIDINYSKNNYIMKNVEVWNTQTSEFEKVNKKRFHDDYFSIMTQLTAGVSNKKWADLFSVSTSYFSSDNDLQTGSVQNVVYGMATRERESYNIASRYQKKDFLIKKLAANLSISHTWDNTKVIDTVYRKYRWDGSYIESSRNEIIGRGKSIRRLKRPLTIARAGFDYSLAKTHFIKFNYLVSSIINDRSDDFDAEFEPSKDKFSKHILGLSYNQKLWQERWVNTFFVKDYISFLKIEQQDLSWITGSDEIKKSSITNNLGYGLSSRFCLLEELSLKTSYEYSVRLPLAREYMGNGTTVYPNFTLKPESSNNVNLGLFGTLLFNSQHRLFYETGLFYRQVKDYIHLVITEAEGTSQYDNVNNVTIKGIEGELRYDYNNLFQLVVNFSYLDERNKTKYQNNGKPSVIYENRMPNRPWLFGNFGFNIKKKNLFKQNDNQLKFAYFFQYVHWFYLTWEGYGVLSSKSTIPTQYLHNAELTYSLKKERYNISLSVDNIFDYTIFDNYMMQKPGRVFFLKLRLFIN